MSLTPYLVAWRTTPLHDREVIDALVDPTHAGPSPELAAALRDWPGTYYWSDEPDGRHLVLTRPSPPPTGRTREAWGTHILLFAATFFMTTLSGAVIAGDLPGNLAILFNPTVWGAAFFRGWVGGLSFSLPLLAILLVHELGHYLTARRYQLDVSPPYFIPGPPAPLGIGTFGAFIRLRTILTDRRQLLDVGAAGPIAGFVVAVPVLWIGLAHSQLLSEGEVRGMLAPLGDGLLPLGDSLITLLFRRLTLGDVPVIILHPMAVAGWFGMFVTMLNLLPIAQLDGGHILYAAVPRWHRRVALALWLIIMVLGLFSLTWLLWAFVVLVLSRGRLAHPPVLDAYRPLPPSRRWLVWASVALFVLTFTLLPSPGGILLRK
ncbi:MAG: site-2 protease family protein [Gemmatimonadales bacterium]